MDDFKRKAALGRAFFACWRRLARQCVCDALDSFEMVRVYQEWVEAGRPLKVLTFITTHANAPSEVKP